MSQTGSAVVYDGLPLSSGSAHGLGRVTPHAAYAAWTGFLSACTEPGPVTCFFALPATPELSVEPRIRAAIGHAFPRSDHRFAVPPERMTEALDLFTALEPQPTNRWGMAPVWLWFVADVALRDPDGLVWPGQDPARFGGFETPSGVRLGASRTQLILQARRSMSLRLSVPEATDTDLALLRPWLQDHLPFRLSAKHWSRWTLAKNGRTYRGRGLPQV